MKMSHEKDVLKSKNEKLLPIFEELQSFIESAARSGELRVDEVEQGVWQQLLKLGFELLNHFFQLLGSGDLGEEIKLPNGQSVKRLEMHTRRYQSIFGLFQLERFVYGSREGQKIEFVPLDSRLKLPESDFSYLLQDWDQSFCVEEAFGQVKRTVERILNLKQSVDSLETMNVQMAQLVEDFREDRPVPPPEEEGEILVSSADGKGIVMRREDGAPAPAVHRTKGDKASLKKMAIVGSVYTVDRYVRTPTEVVAALFRDKRDEPAIKIKRPEPCHKKVVAHLSFDEKGMPSGMESTFDWILNEIHDRNRDHIKEEVFLGDGQEALWDTRDERLSLKNSVGILDILHVTPRIWQAAHLFHSEKSKEVEAFVRERVLKILEGKMSLVIRGLREMGTKRELKGSKKAALAKICNYLEKNSDKMRYDEYLAKGYPIASGVIEGACRHLVKDRMERSGMHWSRAGAQAMLDVRSIHINGDWEDYLAYRIQQQNSNLYPHHELVAGDKFPLAA